MHLLLSYEKNLMDEIFLRQLCAVIWTMFVITLVSVFYVNYFLPHGPSYSTGEYVCQNDERGPCSEQFKEDMSGLDIPDWAKFIRENYLVYISGLGSLGTCLSVMVIEYKKGYLPYE